MERMERVEEEEPELTMQQQEAKDYVTQHGLDRLVTKLMNSVIQDKPGDPKVFMMRWLAERSSLDQLQRAGLQHARSPSPKPKGSKK
mmetsp:Transcript_3897/g.12604  ORF Transcript_3897/g.12604 Transcript_3897/m.12604 type:complete len:87 (-) Transcript_3897:64-324(-)